MKSLLLLMFLAHDPNVVPNTIDSTVVMTMPAYDSHAWGIRCDTTVPYRADTTWHFKRELPTEQNWQLMDSCRCWLDSLQGVHPGIDVSMPQKCYKREPLPTVTISSGSMRWVYGQNDGALYQCYEVPGRIGFTLDSLGGGGFFGVDTTAGGGSIGYKGGGR